MSGDAPVNARGPDSSLWGRAGAVFVFALGLHLAGIWAFPLVDRDEPRFAEATREMRERGDWFVPHFNNHYRFEKPPLAYWAQAISCHIFGESDWSVRLPSVLASALTSLIVFFWGRGHVDEKTGFWAALMFASSLQVLVHSKLCVADPLLILFITLGAWAGWEMAASERISRRNSRIEPLNPDEARSVSLSSTVDSAVEERAGERMPFLRGGGHGALPFGSGLLPGERAGLASRGRRPRQPPLSVGSHRRGRRRRDARPARSPGSFSRLNRMAVVRGQGARLARGYHLARRFDGGPVAGLPRERDRSRGFLWACWRRAGSLASRAVPPGAA